jgi:hypothetical protein
LKDLVDSKQSEAQVRTIVNAYDPYVVESPLEKGRNLTTGEYIIRMDISYDQALYAKADKTSLDSFESSINTRLLDILTPIKINITSDAWAQINIHSNSEEAYTPSEIAFNRQIKNAFLSSAMGVSGDLTRGAYWWAGGEDRININCETGKVKIKNALETPALKADIIQGLSTTTLRIEDNMIIAGNLTVNGAIIASSLNPFWCAGKVNGTNGAVITTKGRVGFTVNRQQVGTFLISMNTAHPDGANYIINTTAQTYHSWVRTGDTYDPTSQNFTIIVINSSNVPSDITFFFTVLA